MFGKIFIAALLLFVINNFISTIGQELSNLEKSHINFAVNLLQNIGESGKSTVISPFSISVALSILHLGANKKTKKQLEEVLGSDAHKFQIQQHFAKLLSDITKVRSDRCMFSTANSIQIRHRSAAKENFLQMLQLFYAETVFNFGYEEKTLFQAVNCHVSEKTNSKITELTSMRRSIPVDRMLILNAAHFKGNWKTYFPEKATRNRAFYISEKEKKTVPMMKVFSKFRYYDDSSVKVVRLPCRDEQFEMVVILPKKSFNLPEVLNGLTGEKLHKYITNAELTKLEVTLPSFRLKQTFHLKEILKRFGITNAFDKSADFSGIISDNIFTEDITHQTTIEVDEEGDEKAVLTSVVTKDMPYRVIKIFEANHPFLYFIVKNSDTVLLAGQFS